MLVILSQTSREVSISFLRLMLKWHSLIPFWIRVNKFIILIKNSIDREAKSLVLCFTKDHLNDFMLKLPSFVNIIKLKTGLLYLPIALQNNPLNPNDEFLVVLQEGSLIKKYEY